MKPLNSALSVCRGGWGEEQGSMRTISASFYAGMIINKRADTLNPTTNRGDCFINALKLIFIFLAFKDSFKQL